MLPRHNYVRFELSTEYDTYMFRVKLLNTTGEIF